MLVLCSKITPRRFTYRLGVIGEVTICNAGVFGDLTQYGDAKYIIFVLLSFRIRNLWVIQRRISAIQCSKFVKEEEKFNSFSGYGDIYRYAPSAYEWHLPPYHSAIIPIRRAYTVKTRRPRNVPCGTPNNKDWTLDKYHKQALYGSIFPVRNLSNTLLDKSNMSFNPCKSILWSTVSNAADRSRRTLITGLL